MAELIPLTGEPLSLDLVNTCPRTPNGTVDLLASVEQLRTWVELEFDRLPELQPRELADLTETDAAAVRELREHIAESVSAVRRAKRPRKSALDGINQGQNLAPSVAELAWESGVVALHHRRMGTFGERLLATLAVDAAELLSSPEAGSIRDCEAEDCVMLFMPARSRRRWCSAARCGNRARVARYYRRHRDA